MGAFKLKQVYKVIFLSSKPSWSKEEQVFKGVFEQFVPLIPFPRSPEACESISPNPTDRVKYAWSSIFSYGWFYRPHFMQVHFALSNTEENQQPSPLSISLCGPLLRDPLSLSFLI